MAQENTNNAPQYQGWGHSVITQVSEEADDDDVAGLQQVRQQLSQNLSINGTNNSKTTNSQARHVHQPQYQPRVQQQAQRRQPQQVQQVANPQVGSQQPVQRWGFPPPANTSNATSATTATVTSSATTTATNASNGGVVGWPNFPQTLPKVTQQQQAQAQAALAHAQAQVLAQARAQALARAQAPAQAQAQAQVQRQAQNGSQAQTKEKTQASTQSSRNAATAADSIAGWGNIDFHQASNDKPEESKNEEKVFESSDQFFAKQKSGIEIRHQGKLVIKGLSDAEQYRSEFETFESMKVLNVKILNAIAYLGWTRPSKIQAAILPVVLNKNSANYGRDVIGQAHHGSGKTGTFILNMLERIDLSKKCLQSLVICHTRELATQTKHVASKLGRNMEGLEIVLAVPRRDKNNADKNDTVPTMEQWRAQVCIGTPGVILFQILQHNNGNPKARNLRKTFLKHFKTLVVDEADEFLGDSRVNTQEMNQSHNFQTRNNARGRGRGRGGRGGGRGRRGPTMYEQLQEIADCFQRQAPKYQTMLFSATFPPEIAKLTTKFGCKNPFEITVEKKELGLKNIKMIIIEVNDNKKRFETLVDILLRLNVGQVIVFTNSVDCTKKLQQSLTNNDEMEGLECSLMIGQMSNKERDAHMDAFRLGESRILIASNVIARGIDVPSVNLVVNYEIPYMRTDNFYNKQMVDGETYMHRVGRTGRFGTKGVCINFVHGEGGRSSNLLNQVLTQYKLQEDSHIIQTQGKKRKHIEKELVEKIGDWIDI